MTTPDPTLAARLTELDNALGLAQAQVGGMGWIKECDALSAALLSAFCADQLITTAEADARVEAAVLAEREAVNTLLDDYPRPVTMHWHADKSFSKLDCCTHGHSMCEDCTQCLEAAIRSRGVTG